VRRLEAWRCVRRGRKRASYLLGSKVEGSGYWDLGFFYIGFGVQGQGCGIWGLRF